MVRLLKLSYKLFILLLCFSFIVYFTSCNSGNQNYIFKTVIYGNPDTLDPQRAECDSSVSVINNIFQGLFTYDNNGQIKFGMIDEYTVDDSGLIWTFYLKENIFWYDGDEFKAVCTADDYVYAFERLFNPETKSDRASEYYIIKNSEAINKGKITDLKQLGVKATDKFTLQIMLEEVCINFIELLAMPPAMPCNREFYDSTEGRYGLASDCIASNSNFYVHIWSYDKWSNDNNYFILRRNYENSGSEKLPYGINLFIDPVDEYKLFYDEITHSYSSYNSENLKELKDKFRYSEYKTGVWGFIFNLNGDFSDFRYRQELSDYIDNSNLNDIYMPFDSIVPYCVMVCDVNYRETAGEISSAINSESENGVGSLSSHNMRMIMPYRTNLRDKIGDIMQEWQSECNFYCSIAELDNSDYNNALANGDFDIALIRLSGEYNSPYAYLNDFAVGNARNYSGYKNRKFEHIMNSAVTADSYLSAINYYTEAEQLLIESYIFIPICIENMYVFYSEKINGVEYNPFLKIYQVTSE